MEETVSYYELVEGIKELGFEGPKYQFEDKDYTLQKEGWSNHRFTKPAEGDLPERVLFVRQHFIHGTTLAIWPIPSMWDDGIYHYSTGRPVSQERALELLRGYVKDTAEGRKYIPEE